jgi:hypothetical protein
MRMKRVAAVGMLVLGASAALAGQVELEPVTVTREADFSGVASGAMGQARFSENNVEAIGCRINHFDNGMGGLSIFGFCHANTAQSVGVVCISQDPKLLEAIAAFNDYSFVIFTWDAQQTCRSIGSSTRSVYIPK